MSKLIPKFTGIVKDNKLILDKPQIFGLYLGILENCRVEIIVQKEKKARSLKMNSLYWVYLKVLEDETGEDSENLHEYFKSIFLPAKIVKIFGKEVRIPGSTTELSSLEFTEYIDKIERLTGISCPDPNDFYSEVNC